MRPMRLMRPPGSRGPRRGLRVLALALRVGLGVGLGLGLVAGPIAHAAEPGEPDEDALFGGGGDGEGSSEPAGASRGQAAGADGGQAAPAAGEEDEARILSGDHVGDEDDADESGLDDPLSIGGQLYLRTQAFLTDRGAAGAQRLSMPNLLDLYLDARPVDRVRAFVNGRLRFDPTVADGDTDALGRPAKMTSVVLDQAWIKTDIGRAVFLTLGQQRIKWGASRIWNPTDVVNATRRNPVAFFDERTGVPLLKVHVPVESIGWNAYALALFEGADGLGQLGGAGRLEMVFGPSEWAVSVAGGEGRKTTVGLDVSAGVWDLDVHAELGLADESGTKHYGGTFSLGDGTLPTMKFPSERTLDAWYARVSAGADYTFRVGDNDLMVLGAEYFYNPLGYDEPSLYPWLLAQGAFEPFYLGQHYVGLIFAVPSPGNWDDVTFTTSTLANLSDQSFLSRLDMSWILHTRLRLEAFVMVHYGHRGGELRMGLDLPAVDQSVRDLIQAQGGEDPFGGQALTIPGPVVDLGIHLRLAL